MDTVVIEQCFDSGPKPKLWTADEFLKLAELGLFEDSESLELLDGEIVKKMSPIGVEHEISVSHAFRWLVQAVPPEMGVY